MITGHELLIIGIYITGGLIVGWAVSKWIVPLLRMATQKTKWKSDDLIIESIQQWVTFWFVLLGVLLAAEHINLDRFVIKKEVTYASVTKNIVVSLFIFSLTWILARISAGLIDIRTSKGDSEIPSSSIVSNIVKVIVYCIGIMLIIQHWGFSITPILTALGVGGLAVALALQDTLSNLFSGIQIIASRKISPGDFITLESGQSGIVEDITWRNTTIQTLPGNTIIIPNSKLANSIVQNNQLPDTATSFFVGVGVGYESDLDKVERISLEVAREVLNEVEGGVPDFEPFVRFYEYGDSSINLKIFMRGKEFTSQYLISHEFIKRLTDRYRKENINIPFPIRTVFHKSMDNQVQNL